MKIKATLFLFIASTLLFTGCSSNKEENATPAAPNAAPSTETSETEQPAEQLEHMDLKWAWTSRDNNASLPDLDKDFVRKAIEEKFNVSIDFSWNIPEEKLTVMLASKNVPDLFISWGNKYAQDGLAVNMTPFVTPETMPNYFKWVDEKTLKFYQIKGVEFGRAPIPYAKNIPIAYWVRKDWLDNLGLGVPKTYQELLNVMRAFSNDDPDGNGKKDTYGFSTGGSGGELALDFPQWIEYGYPGGSFNIDGDQFKRAGVELDMQQILTDVKQMMTDGSLDPDSYTQEWPKNIEKGVQGKVGVIFDGDPNFGLEGDPNSRLNQTRALNPKAEWLPTFPFDKPYIWTKGGPGVAFQFPTNEDPEKIKRMTQILDWLCSEEGYLLTHYGVKDVHYTRSGNQITLIPDAFNRDIVQNGNFLAVYGAFTPDEPDQIGLELIDPRMSEKDRETKKLLYSFPKKDPIPGVSVPEGFDLGEFVKKQGEFTAKALIKDKDASNWPKYREELMTKYKGYELLRSYAEQTAQNLGIQLQRYK